MKRGFIYQIWIWCSEGASVNPPFYYILWWGLSFFVQQDKSMGYYGFVPTHPHEIANLTKGKNCMMDHDGMKLCSTGRSLPLSFFIPCPEKELTLRCANLVMIVNPHDVNNVSSPQRSLFKEKRFPTSMWVYHRVCVCHPECWSLMGNDVVTSTYRSSKSCLEP